MEGAVVVAEGIEVLTGSAIVYGAAVDNTSGAMSLQIARGAGE